MSPVNDLLTDQIGHEFFASQQYVAIAVWYDQQALPQLAAHFYAQAVEERNHAMMIVQYLMDREAEVVIPGVAGGAQRVRVGGRATRAGAVPGAPGDLADRGPDRRGPRRRRDYLGEQFMHWFLKEQVEEVASISTLLQVGRRVGENVMLLEDYLARETGASGGADPTAPTAAGGAL